MNDPERTVVSIIPGFPAKWDYDDDGFTRASNELVSSIGGMISNGASSEDIENAIRDGLENA